MQDIFIHSERNVLNLSSPVESRGSPENNTSKLLNLQTVKSSDYFYSKIIVTSNTTRHPNFTTICGLLFSANINKIIISRC